MTGFEAAGRHVPGSGWLVGIDTATRRAAIAIGTGRGTPRAWRSWEAGYRHGEELLAVLDELMREAGIGLSDVGAIVSGIGPGAFTGLRVGLATAKGLAYGLHVPLVGIASTRGLALAALASGTLPGDAGSPARHAPAWDSREGPATVAVAMPAGPHDRYLARYRVTSGAGDIGRRGAPGRGDIDRRGAPGRGDVGRRAGARDARGPQGGEGRALELEPIDDPVLVPGGEAIEPLLEDATLVAVDLAGRPGVSDDALVLGRAAQEGLGAALLAAGREALDRGDVDDVAALVPAYVTLPRGITAQTGTIEWSRDLQ